MSQPAPAGAVCATHVEAEANWACGRCGAFFCAACERRTRPDARPMCPNCWQLRAKVAVVVKPVSKTRLQTAGLVMGAFSLVPFCWWFQIAAIVVSIVGIVKAKEGAAREVRWRAVLGLVLAAVGLSITVLALAFGGKLFD